MLCTNILSRFVSSESKNITCGRFSGFALLNFQGELSVMPYCIALHCQSVTGYLPSRRGMFIVIESVFQLSIESKCLCFDFA